MSLLCLLLPMASSSRRTTCVLPGGSLRLSADKTSSRRCSSCPVAQSFSESASPSQASDVAGPPKLPPTQNKAELVSLRLKIRQLTSSVSALHRTKRDLEAKTCSRKRLTEEYKVKIHRISTKLADLQQTFSKSDAALQQALNDVKRLWGERNAEHTKSSESDVQLSAHPPCTSLPDTSREYRKLKHFLRQMNNSLVLIEPALSRVEPEPRYRQLLPSAAAIPVQALLLLPLPLQGGRITPKRIQIELKD